eukprot:gnl/MRDRNA2_/MRDRNA2_124705_c0_seq1.p1 gnl/MRDRNA2_/MRDRNA2_124705_c0~~gnl/MRDRNA2_/MRDRNA2_124705_c0_seq1.p1  ORF type:complete len:583 (+),score=128.43 gnl/MRDRNA2_/MRDRNA2_124705_c0_seq1:183-1931(+)
MGASQCCNTAVPAPAPMVNRAPMSEPVATIKSAVNDVYENTDQSLSESGNCYAVRNKATQLDYACHKIAKAEAPCKDKAAIASHVSKVCKLEHPHLCKMVECFEDKDHYLMIYEKASDRTMMQHLDENKGKLHENDVMKLVRQITMVLSLAHSRGIVHGRFCPDVVVLSAPEEEDEIREDHVKICNMGLGFIFRPCALASRPVKLKETAPPEIIWDEVSDDGMIPELGSKLDIWGLGVVTHLLITGKLPFHADTTEKTIQKIKTEAVEYELAIWGEQSQKANSFIRQILQLNPEMRPSALKLLQHPWLQRRKVEVGPSVMTKLLGNTQGKLTLGMFRKLVLRVIVRQLDRNSRQMENIKSVFCSLDKDTDGTLSSKELIDGIKKCKITEIEEEDLMTIFDVLDRDGSGTLNLQEFCVATIKEDLAFTRANLWQAFAAFDEDKDGEVSLDDIERMVRKQDGSFLGREQLNEFCVQLREELEIVPGGKMDFDQFYYICNSQEGKPSRKRAMQRNCYRCCHGCCGVDCYDVRKLEPKEWVLSQKGMAPQSTWSAYDKGDDHRKSQHRAKEPATKGRASSKDKSPK